MLGPAAVAPLALLSGLVLAGWLILSLAPRWRWPKEAILESTTSLQPLAAVSAIVPARNEAEILPQTLPTLLAQAEIARLLVVDDDSSDATGETVQHFTELDERVILIHAGPRLKGWAGKVHALARGVEHTQHEASEEPESESDEWLLFSDADIAHREGSLASLLAKADGGYDLVSVMARLNACNGWERFLVPPFVFFFHLLYPFRSVADPRSRVAAAAGGCVLVRRGALERAGGLAAISGALIDDVALARALKSSGARLWLGFDPGIVSRRSYRFGDLWAMVSRSAFVQLGHRWDLLALTVLGVLLFFVSPPFLIIAGGALAATGNTPGWGVAAAAVLTWALATRALLPYVRHHRVPAAWAGALPLASLFYALMTLGSAWNHLRGRTASWRGRRYP